MSPGDAWTDWWTRLSAEPQLRVLQLAVNVCLPRYYNWTMVLPKKVQLVLRREQLATRRGQSHFRCPGPWRLRPGSAQTQTASQRKTTAHCSKRVQFRINPATMMKSFISYSTLKRDTEQSTTNRRETHFLFQNGPKCQIPQQIPENKDNICDVNGFLQIYVCFESDTSNLLGLGGFWNIPQVKWADG